MYESVALSVEPEYLQNGCLFISHLCVSSLGILTMIIVRTLRRDIAKYNKIDEEVCLHYYYVITIITPPVVHSMGSVGIRFLTCPSLCAYVYAGRGILQLACCHIL